MPRDIAPMYECDMLAVREEERRLKQQVTKTSMARKSLQSRCSHPVILRRAATTIGGICGCCGLRLDEVKADQVQIPLKPGVPYFSELMYDAEKRLDIIREWREEQRQAKEGGPDNAEQS